VLVEHSDGLVVYSLASPNALFSHLQAALRCRRAEQQNWLNWECSFYIL